MSAGRIVEDDDLEPFGWACEACGSQFEVGDEAHGVLVAVMPDATPVEGEWRCTVCWLADTPVVFARKTG